MNKHIIIAVSLLLLISACTKKSSTSSSPSTASGDTTFNGSYIQLTIGGKSFTEKDATVKTYGHIVTLTTSIVPYVTPTTLDIVIIDNYGTYGLAGPTSGINGTQIFAEGTGTGTYTKVHGAIVQVNPFIQYTDSTGTMNITYNGSDYIQGTINSTCYANGFSYPLTGSFKIYH